MDIKAIIFDLDGVLTNTSEYHYRAWKRLADELDIPFDRQRNEPLRGVPRRRSLELLLDGRPATEEQMQEWMTRKNRYYGQLIQQMTPADILPGTLELLREARQAGIKIGIGSASKNTHTVLDRLGLWDYVDAVSDGYSVQRHKPAPDLFLHCARQLGVEPDEAIVVEDAASGVEAALAGGFWAMGLGPAERVGAAHLIFPSLENVHLQEILSAMNHVTRNMHHASRINSRNWLISETTFDPDRLHHQETVFTIGNGYLGTRGAFEEGYPGARPATLIHGLFDDAPIVHTELANAPDWLPFVLLVSGERFGMERGELLDYERTLDMRRGLLTRRVRWRSPAGHTVDIHIERFASLADPHVLAIRYQVTPLDFDGLLEFRAGINGHVDNDGYVHWDWVDQGGEPGKVWLHSRTRRSGIELGQAAALVISGGDEVTERVMDCRNCPTTVAICQAQREQTVTAEKLVTIYTSRDPEQRGVVEAAQEKLAGLLQQGLSYEDSRAAHEAAWAEVWDAADVIIEGDDVAQRAVRYNLFQLLIAAPRDDDRVSIPGKTLSGFGYRGHVFWDTDIFMLPFFTFTQPKLARNLLLYRYHTLPAARRKARANGYEGAQYAWESALTGDETTPKWVPGPAGEWVRIWTGDIQLHITADVAYAVWQYWRVSGDDEFMRDYGAEIILDTAVFWGSRVEYNDERDRYEINDVIGPDEYHEHVNNNAFTNRMAQWHLETALETLAWLRREYLDKAAELEERLDLSAERLAHWADVIGCLHILHDPETGLMEQFEGFFELEDVDWQALEPRRKSVQTLLGIERTNQVQALKQPDVLMLLYLLGDRYDPETKRVNWDYYAPRTDHAYGSSLGPAVHAILACELGLPEVAYDHFMRAALVDLEDVRENAADGIHGGSAGGVWQAVVFGFAGLKVNEAGWHVEPRVPIHWRRLAFRFYHRGKVVEIDLRPRRNDDSEIRIPQSEMGKGVVESDK